MSEIQTKVRPDRGLLAAFGYERCADASVIQQTLDAATEATVASLEAAIAEMCLKQGHKRQVSLASQEEIHVDIDLSSLPIGKRAEGSEKGYVAKKPNTYTRQLARMVCGDTQEIFTQELYPGKTNSDAVFKPMLGKLETVLTLDTVEKRNRVRIRFDAGFGTDANINYALWRGYQLLGKMYNSRRIQKLAGTVEAWESVPTSKGVKGREAGWVKEPHRYARRTVQVAVRTPRKMALGVMPCWSQPTRLLLLKIFCLNMTNAVVPQSVLSLRIIKHSLYENTEKQDLSHSKFCFYSLNSLTT